MSLSKRSEKFIDDGISLYNSGQIKEAVNAFKKAVDEDPDNPVAHGNLGKLYKQEGRLDPAMKCFRRALEIDPTDLDAQFELGELLVEKEMYYDAVTHFAALMEAVSEEEADSIAARIENIMERARIKLESGMLGTDVEEILEFGYYCIEQGMPSIAVDVFKKGLSLVEKQDGDKTMHANILLGMGMAYYHKQMDDKAVKHLEKALALDTSRPEPYIELSDIHLERAMVEAENGNMDESEKELMKAETYLMNSIEKGVVDNPEIYDRIGDIHLVKKEYDEALAAFQKCIDIEPEYASDYGIYEKLFNTRKEISESEK
jgi:tetratricopeptide (TPR) repeat protein